MKRISGKWKGTFFLLVLSAFLVWGGSREVSAASKCKVVFANAQGVVSTQTYRNWARTVEAGDWIKLPKYSQSGYRCYWVLKNGNKTYKYNPGANYRITKNTKFCLYRYKLYNVCFYTENGKKEYLSMREQAIKGQYITLPSVPHGTSNKGLGWSTTVRGKTYKKAGTKVKVTGNMRFYPITQKITGVNLRAYNGKLWKVVPTDSGKNPVFPSVNLGSGNMCLGWSRTKGQTSKPEYLAGDRIPSKSGNYYMVVFGKHMDKAPAGVRKPENHDVVYFVGDSRTMGMARALGSSVPANVKFIYKIGEGLDWFKKTGYNTLRSNVCKQSKNSRIAVVINLGANDLRNYSGYTKYMQAVARDLKKYRKNCDMYYMSVNPVNSAMIRSYLGWTSRTENQVKSINNTLKSALCSGSRRTYTYIDTCSFLQRYGWISREGHDGLCDGVHYSDATSLRIYDYCMKILNR